MLRQSIFEYLQDCLLEKEQGKDVYVKSLSAKDRALFQEIVLGSLKQWYFIADLASTYAVSKDAHKNSKPTSKPISSRNLQLLCQFGYEILFLDKIPTYAVYSEFKKLSKTIKLSEKEQKFIHAILKRFETDKSSIKDVYEDYLSTQQLVDWRKVSGNPSFWAALNVPSRLGSKFLDIVYPQARKELKDRIVTALAIMKQRKIVLGYQLADAKDSNGLEKYRSKLSDRVIKIGKEYQQADGTDFLEGLEKNQLQIQGEASIYASDLFASYIYQYLQEKQTIKILEVGTGKGGKLLSTLSALSARNIDFNRIDWTAVDESIEQLDILKQDKLPFINKHFKGIQLTLVQQDFSKGSSKATEELSTRLTKGAREASLQTSKKLSPGAEFDLIWIDAPCSGLGTLAKLPQIMLTRATRLKEHLQETHLLQTKLCSQALNVLRPGGFLFYSVCTFTKAETEDVVSAVTTDAASSNKSLTSKKVHCVQSELLLPNFRGMEHVEGFFLAGFRSES